MPEGVCLFPTLSSTFLLLAFPSAGSRGVGTPHRTLLQSEDAFQSSFSGNSFGSGGDWNSRALVFWATGSLAAHWPDSMGAQARCLVCEPQVAFVCLGPQQLMAGLTG